MATDCGIIGVVFLCAGIVFVLVESLWDDFDDVLGRVLGAVTRCCCGCCKCCPSRASSSGKAVGPSQRSVFLATRRVAPFDFNGDVSVAGAIKDTTAKPAAEAPAKRSKPSFGVFAPLQLTKQGLLMVDVWGPAIAWGLISSGLSTMGHPLSGLDADVVEFITGALDAATTLFKSVSFLPVFCGVFFLTTSVARWRNIKTSVFGMQGKIHAFSLSLAAQPWGEWGKTEILWRFFRRLNAVHYLEYRTVAAVYKKTSLEDLVEAGLLTEDELGLLNSDPSKELPAVLGWMARDVAALAREGCLAEPVASRWASELAGIQGAAAGLHIKLTGVPPSPPSQTAFMVLMFRAYVMVISLNLANEARFDEYCVQPFPLVVTTFVVAAFDMLLRVPKLLVDPFGTDEDDTNVDGNLCATEKVMWAHMRTHFTVGKAQARMQRVERTSSAAPAPTATPLAQLSAGAGVGSGSGHPGVVTSATSRGDAAGSRQSIGFSTDAPLQSPTPPRRLPHLNQPGAALTSTGRNK